MTAKHDRAAPADGARRRTGPAMVPMLLALTAALLGIAAFITATIMAERDARQGSARETNALVAVQQLLQAVLDAETGQRRFLLTGRATYLEPYLIARQRIGPALTQLREHARAIHDDDVAFRAAQLERRVRAKLAELEMTIAFARSGRRAEALAAVSSDFGLREMGEIRQDATWLIAEQSQRRSAAFARATMIEQRLVALVVLLGAGVVVLVLTGLQAERERARSALAAEQTTALRDSNARAQLLTQELNHRIKNLFSVVLAIVSLSSRKQIAEADIIEDIRARIQALALAHQASQGGDSQETVMLGTVISRIMEPYRDAAIDRIRIDGPAQPLPVRDVTPIGLIIHELATNAVKYGALSNRDGAISIRWASVSDGGETNQLQLQWIETGGPELLIHDKTALTSGYGSRMVVMATRQLRGEIERLWPASGVVVRITFPVS